MIRRALLALLVSAPLPLLPQVRRPVARPGTARVAPLATFTVIAAGPSHTCGLTSTGAAYCWGNNWRGQLGDGTTTGRTSPVAVLGGLVFQAVTVGAYYTCGLTTGGAAYCWGDNWTGQLGDGTSRSRTSPVSVVGGRVFKAISAGRDHTCGLTTANDQMSDKMRPGGIAYCWGANGAGQLGDGTSSSRASPVAVSGGLIFKAISGGGDHTCGLTEQLRRQPSGRALAAGGIAYCWGANNARQLGDGTTSSRTSPVAVSGGRVFRAISAGRGDNCGLTTGGAAYCWGSTWYGQRGDGTTTSPAGPVPVADGLVLQAISVGDSHTCGLTTGGTAFCWGDNEYGELGDGTTVSRAGPAAVSGGLVFQTISASPRDPAQSSSGSHTCGLTTGGAVFCWGYNDNGALGDGTTTARRMPVAVQRPPDTPAPVQPTDRRAATGHRDLSTPATRLVGHWASPSDRLDFYFGPIDAATNTGSLTQVAVGSGGAVTRLRYTIVVQAPAGEEDVELRIEGGGVVGRINRLSVAREGQTLTWRFVQGDIGLQRDLRYVDAQTAPK